MLDRPVIRNLQWAIEHQLEPDDETQFTFDIENTSNEYSIRIQLLKFTFPTVNGVKVPAYVGMATFPKNNQILQIRIQCNNMGEGESNDDNGPVLLPKSSIKVTAYLGTSTSLYSGPHSYPCRFSIDISINWSIVDIFNGDSIFATGNTIVED